MSPAFSPFKVIGTAWVLLAAAVGIGGDAKRERAGGLSCPHNLTVIGWSPRGSHRAQEGARGARKA
jgi:hypothetical protein